MFRRGKKFPTKREDVKRHRKTGWEEGGLQNCKIGLLSNILNRARHSATFPPSVRNLYCSLAACAIGSVPSNLESRLPPNQGRDSSGRDTNL